MINYDLLSYVSSNNHTKFSVKDFISIAENYRMGDIAERCLSKDFIEFSHDNNNSSGQKINTEYDYFYVGNNPSNRLKTDQGKCRDKMKERLSIWNSLNRIEYAIKDANNYHDFIDSIKSYQLVMPDSERKIEVYNNVNHYTIKNCVFADNGYNIERHIYRICIYPCETFVQFKNQEIANAILYQKQQDEARKEVEINKLKQDSINTVYKLFTQGGTAIISVIHTFVYKDKNEDDSHVIDTLKKGDKVSVKATQNTFCRCDYNLDNGKTGIGYILKSDLMPDNSH